VLYFSENAYHEVRGYASQAKQSLMGNFDLISSRKMKLSLLILAATLHLSVCQENFQPRDSSIECFIAYLKHNNVSDEFVSSLRSMSFVSEACKAGVEFEKIALVQETNINLQNRKNVECLAKEMMKSETLPDLLLNMRVLRTVNDGSLQRFGNFLRGTKTPKDKSVERVEAGILSIVTFAEDKCELASEFANLFDSFFDSDPESDDYVKYEEVQEFCIRKELSEKLLIDLAAFNIKIVPRSVHVKCNEILSPLKTEMIESLKDQEVRNPNKQQISCLISSLRDGNDYFYLLLKAELLSKLGLFVEQKLSEKNNFVDAMTRLAMEIREKC
jgi:hypothetical protein